MTKKEKIILATQNRAYKPKKVSVEGHGRKKGQKNITKLPDGGLINQHGVEFTLAEQKALISKVNSAVRKSKRMREKIDGYSLLLGVEENGMLRSGSDLLFRDWSKSLQQFKTKQAYENYMYLLNRVTERNYQKRVAEEMKRRYTDSLNTLGMKEESIHVMNMSIEEFAMRVSGNVFEEITFMYNPDDEEAMKERIRSGMNFKGEGLPVDVKAFKERMKKREERLKRQKKRK